jgi:hypothetical protein
MEDDVKFEDVLVEWDKDCIIDKTELGYESVKIPKLHNKYYKIFIAERSALKSLEAQMKILKLDKHEFYTQGHTQETKEKGWELPARGMILKSDLSMYMDADKDIIALSLKIGLQQEKVEALEAIIKTLNNRGYLLKTAMDWVKFQNGG